MTDRITALTCLAESSSSSAKDAALQEFYESNKDQPLNLLKWLRVQAASSAPGNVARVKALVGHPAFHINNPNNCYSLFLAFGRSVNFHALDGSGYEFMGDSVLQVGVVCFGGGVAGTSWCCWFTASSSRELPESNSTAQAVCPSNLADKGYQL
jgi:aminopeptidase N